MKGGIAKTLDELVDSLGDQGASLTEALLKTKVLLHKLGHGELTEWVNNELNGYAEIDTLPPYRILPGVIKANVSNGVWTYSSQPLPVMHLTESQRDNFGTFKMSQPLTVLEGMLKNRSEKSRLQAHLPLELSGILSKTIDRTYAIQQVWLEGNFDSIGGILTQVRSRLLDFVLGLNGHIQNDLTDSEAKAQTENIDMPGIFKHAIFGDNTTILVGQNNTQTVRNSKTVQGDFNSLADELRRHKVSEPDISSLRDAISQDENSIEVLNKQPGPAVKGWMKTMFDKAVDATWNIDLGIVSGLLTTSIQKYFGWG